MPLLRDRAWARSCGIRAKNPEIADQIAVNYRKADITPRQRAMLDFAMKVSVEANKITEQDFADIAAHGFSDDDIWDIAAISASSRCRTGSPTSPPCARTKNST